jgi:hypothetical protein
MFRHQERTDLQLVFKRPEKWFVPSVHFTSIKNTEDLKKYSSEQLRGGGDIEDKAR